jgi:hypothetical protein
VLRPFLQIIFGIEGESQTKILKILDS